jgi:hypothetical protein
VELTENVLQTGSLTIAALRQLREDGVRIALDDFGTGYSSLASLDQLPITRVKLDRSLIAEIDTTARCSAIVSATIQLCRDLGLEVTAEGIERPAQFRPCRGTSPCCRVSDRLPVVGRGAGPGGPYAADRRAPAARGWRHGGHRWRGKPLSFCAPTIKIAGHF